MKISRLLATVFGIGYIQKGAGTIAALFCCFTWYLFGAANYGWTIQLSILLAVFATGVVVGDRVEEAWGKDSNRVVIDEVQGMLVALFLLPHNWQYGLAAFVLFRFFDIAKPLGIQKMEKFAGGWGVMLDDLVAGLYSNVILQVVLYSNLSL